MCLLCNEASVFKADINKGKLNVSAGFMYLHVGLLQNSNFQVPHQGLKN